MAPERSEQGPLAAGWAALAEGDWTSARTLFEESQAERENPEALEGLGWVGHVLDDDQLTFESRERAYRLYRERGESGSASPAAGAREAASSSTTTSASSPPRPTVAAECDPRVGLRAKRWFDVVGHYGREDVLARGLAADAGGRAYAAARWRSPAS